MHIDHSCIARAFRSIMATILATLLLVIFSATVLTTNAMSASCPKFKKNQFFNLNLKGKRDNHGWGTLNKDHGPKERLKTVAKNWMAGLGPSLRLYRLSIPGTHDSGAYRKGKGGRTQTWTIGNQLRAGIRYLDIRVRMTNNKKSWQLVHSHIDLKRHNGEILRFGYVMGVVKDFLRKHPCETVFMRIKTDKGARSDRLRRAWKKYVDDYNDIIYHVEGSYPAADVRLGQLRGKVFVLSGMKEIDDPIKDRFGKEYYFGGWDWNHMIVQDYWDLGTFDKKKKKIKAKLRTAKKNTNKNKIVINHVSCSGRMTAYSCAVKMNPYVFPTITEGKAAPIGFIIMDYPGEALIYRIIKQNFLY